MMQLRPTLRWIAPTLLALVVCEARADDPLEGVEARLSTPVQTIHPGKPIRVRFSLQNHTDRPVVLSVPDVETEPVRKVIDLPLAHVFSGVGYGALTVRGDFDRTWTDAFGYEPPSAAPDLVLAPHAGVEKEIEVTQYYPALTAPGRYRLVWQPYHGLVVSNTLAIDVAPLKQAKIITDDGTMTVQLFYDVAPNHVANFIELVRQGFYNQKTFHRVYTGYFIQGGCPRGDGTGIRPDGKKLKAEFSDYPVTRGTVLMARLESDPDSASCQFIIANTRMPKWDGQYTGFGQLVGEESYETLDNLMSHAVDEQWRPELSVRIRAIQLVDAPVEEDLAAIKGPAGEATP